MICNPATESLGEPMRAEAQAAGAEAVLAVMAERASHAGEPPASLAEAMAGGQPAQGRIRDRIAAALWQRLALSDPELVRAGAATLALPQNAALGARLVWETADTIWTGLGDRSEDVSWWTKRATLASVWGAVVLYWLGDNSAGHADTRAFIDRRIGDVMRIERLKAGLRDLPGAAPLTKLATGWIRKPRPAPAPGHRGRA